jgi:CheY-like chemotaxis protein
MTEKLPRRSSRRVVVSSGSVHPTVTRVVSTSSAAQAASSSPRGSPANSEADVTSEHRAGAASLPPFEPRRTGPGNAQPSGSEPKSPDGSLAQQSDRAGGELFPEELFPEQPPREPPNPDRSPEPPCSEIISTDFSVGSRIDGSHHPPSSGRGPRALVVDDDPEIRRALARLLRPELEVHLVGSVAQAEAVLARLDRVDVAFVDWELPDGTGEQILEKLAHWPDAIRVLISARVVSSENPLKNRALANLVLGKPLALGAVEALKRAALALPHD